ncbi:hypothetical protein HKD21_11530 [Gluconobacter cerevisiae]|uniref:Uncharacterized protein n=2 Tax=Gluconobacter TaxID=441 RepID=A0ABR9YGL5_9PROT|nr:MULTISPECIES: hypothetical protein [Gluconobacter]MBF0877474.1 hypothetical protein [Gluconobacter cerevisiae]GBR32366.1 hypothetical protein AA3266_1056 [Gluconobacter kondonii NBRC 3266]GLQ65235.1 hypothetical protein GCM10007870_08190 [Gluconobacter kondonii]
MKNMNTELTDYLNLLIETATGGYEKRWKDLKRNLQYRLKQGVLYVTPDEATGLRYNSQKNRSLKKHPMPACLAIIVSEALNEEPKTVSLPDPEPQDDLTLAAMTPETLNTIADAIRDGDLTPEEARMAFGLIGVKEEELPKQEAPSRVDHSIWDLNVKKSQAALTDAATDLIRFCHAWAQEIREKP